MIQRIKFFLFTCAWGIPSTILLTKIVGKEGFMLFGVATWGWISWGISRAMYRRIWKKEPNHDSIP